jgi:hypothetical protein
MPRLKSIAAIHRREFVPRDPLRSKQHWRCTPRRQTLGMGTTRGASESVRAQSDFRLAQPGGEMAGMAATASLVSV